MASCNRFIITDSTVYGLYGDTFQQPAYIIPAGERAKSFATVEAIVSRLLELRAGRDAVLVGIGGGVVCDITGFVASIYKRGVEVEFEPTTLLAQVDAAHGGKNGVDVAGVKNAAGFFKMPLEVRLKSEYLRTLPQREYLAGVAEMLKTFLIADAALYHNAAEFLKAHNKVSDLHDDEVLAQLGEFVRAAADIKKSIVSEDPFDHGRRALLNLGHTYGHAIEMHSDLLHGEAVAIGTIIAARMSEKLAGLPHKDVEHIAKDFDAIGLPTDSPVDLETLGDLVANDKKIKGGKLQFVVLESIGCAALRSLENL